MKRGTIIFILLQVLFCLESRTQPAGFEGIDCGMASNPAYHYENYTQGSHGQGYRLYHNDSVILERFYDMGGYTGEYLHFASDSVGFFAEQCVFVCTVYRISGDKVRSYGGDMGFFTDAFVVNPYAVYIVERYPSDPYESIYIFRYTDTPHWKYILQDSSFSEDITVEDTVQGNPLCDSLQKVVYRVKNGTDTIRYTINLHVVDPVYDIEEKDPVALRIYPNPVSDFFQLSGNIPENMHCIRILNATGQAVRTFSPPLFPEMKIPAGDLGAGIYILEFVGPGFNSRIKLVKL